MWQGNMIKLKAAIALVGMLGVPALTMADEKFTARLDGVKEVPVCSSLGRAKFEATISEDESYVDFVLKYVELEGTVSVAHIHLGKPTEAGGIIAFLCGDGVKPACPASPGTVTGTLVAADVIGPVSQGIAAGEFREFLRALRKGLTYANVHSDICPSGEVRGQIQKIKKG